MGASRRTDLQALPSGGAERLAGVLDTGETALDLLSGGPSDEVLFTLGDGRVLVGGIVAADLWGEGLQRMESRHDCRTIYVDVSTSWTTWHTTRTRVCRRDGEVGEQEVGANRSRRGGYINTGGLADQKCKIDVSLNPRSCSEATQATPRNARETPRPLAALSADLRARSSHLFLTPFQSFVVVKPSPTLRSAFPAPFLCYFSAISSLLVHSSPVLPLASNGSRMPMDTIRYICRRSLRLECHQGPVCERRSNT
jgi:hypothetical protein